MLRSYLPAIVFVLVGAGLGGVFAAVNSLLGPRPPRRDDSPYECGLPSHVRHSFRFGVGFYLVAILFLIFDLEVLLLFPVSLQLEAFGLHALGAVGIFIALLGVAFVYEWRRGSLRWDDGPRRDALPHAAPPSGTTSPPSVGAGTDRAGGGERPRRHLTPIHQEGP